MRSVSLNNTSNLNALSPQFDLLFIKEKMPQKFDLYKCSMFVCYVYCVYWSFNVITLGYGFLPRPVKC